MPRLEKRFHLSEVVSENRCIGGISFVNGYFCYRSGRPGRTDFPEKTLKIGRIADDYSVSRDSIKNIYPPDGYVASDGRLFDFNGETYINVNFVQPAKNLHGYVSRMCLYNVELKKFVFLKSANFSDVEKNFSYFCVEDKLFFTRSIWKGIQEIYEVDPVSGVCNLMYVNEFHSNFEKLYGDMRHCSNSIRVGGSFFSMVHSHTNELPHLYNIGIAEFDAEPPFRFKRISSKAILDPEWSEVIYPVGLQFFDERFFVGMGLAGFDYMDIISFSNEEIEDHFEFGVTYKYPDLLFGWHNPHLIKVGNVARIREEYGWFEMFGEWARVRNCVVPVAQPVGWALGAFREPMHTGNYLTELEVLIDGAADVPLFAVGFSEAATALDPTNLSSIEGCGTWLYANGKVQKIQFWVEVAENAAWGFWTYKLNPSGKMRVIGASITKVDKIPREKDAQCDFRKSRLNDYCKSTWRHLLLRISSWLGRN
jgi:hypothetical protein